MRQTYESVSPYVHRFFGQLGEHFGRGSSPNYFFQVRFCLSELLLFPDISRLEALYFSLVN